MFIDGEDMGRNGELENFCIGSKLFAKKNLYKPPKLAICLDMIADKDPQFKMEYFSLIQAENDLKEIWALANELGYSEFTYNMRITSRIDKINIHDSILTWVLIK